MEAKVEKGAARASTPDTAVIGQPALPTTDARENNSDKEILLYVVGPPGSGKSTQCSKIVSEFGFSHLSVGDLLQAEIEAGSEHGKMINEYKKEGKLVPSEIVIKILEKAMKRSKTKKFLIDGFPRNQENLAAANNLMKIEPDIVLYFDCPEEESIRRLLKRNQGRVDDNEETIRKRLEVYYESTLPVIDYYLSKGKVLKIDTGKSIEEVFEPVKNSLRTLEGCQC